MIHIAGRTYEVVSDHKSGWKPEAFRDRYSEVLERYDYIVGDWGYNQLRLRGFYKDNNPKATKDTAISTLQDYLNEYCNFGCAYFIIEKVPGRQGIDPQGQAGEEDLFLDTELPSEQPVGEQVSAYGQGKTHRQGGGESVPHEREKRGAFHGQGQAQGQRGQGSRHRQNQSHRSGASGKPHKPNPNQGAPKPKSSSPSGTEA